jgi:hypothetical protein
MFTGGAGPGNSTAPAQFEPTVGATHRRRIIPESSGNASGSTKKTVRFSPGVLNIIGSDGPIAPPRPISPGFSGANGFLRGLGYRSNGQRQKGFAYWCGKKIKAAKGFKRCAVEAYRMSRAVQQLREDNAERVNMATYTAAYNSYLEKAEYRRLAGEEPDKVESRPSTSNGRGQSFFDNLDNFRVCCTLKNSVTICITNSISAEYTSKFRI